jgi:hypothetical protein
MIQLSADLEEELRFLLIKNLNNIYLKEDSIILYEIAAGTAYYNEITKQSYVFINNDWHALTVELP